MAVRRFMVSGSFDYGKNDGSRKASRWFGDVSGNASRGSVAAPVNSLVACQLHKHLPRDHGRHSPGKEQREDFVGIPTTRHLEQYRLAGM